MIHPHTELRFINEAVGYGVVATRFIPKGTVTWVKDKLDRTFSPAKVKELGKHYFDIMEKYCYRDRKGHYVLCWDISRFVNHSFNPSCFTTPYDFEFAIRDIHPGEELTDDYGYLNVSEPFECLPEEGSSRRVVYPDDIIRFAPEWDQKLKDVFPLFTTVDQPLTTFMSRQKVTLSREIAEGKREMDSITTCYFQPKKR